MKLGKKTIVILFFCLLGLSFSSATSAASCSYHCNDRSIYKTTADFCYNLGGTVGGLGACTGQNTCGIYMVPECCCDTGNFTVNNGQITNNATPSETTKSQPKFKIPELSIKIPGMAKFSEANCTGTPSVCSVNWIGEYVGGIYKYASGVAGIAAVIVLMIGGIIWLVSGGDASRVTQSKELIIGSVSGLTLLLCSYIILYQVNPDLTKFKSLSLGYINEIELEGDSDAPGISLDMTNIAKILGVTCGQDSVEKIVNQAKGKVTYSQENRGKSAPGGFVYLDCSSFSSFAFKCATGRATGQRSADIFSDQTVWNQKLESLKPGDMVGWAPKNNTPKNGGKPSGHVIIYMGNGLFGDCHGGSGKKPGNCISSNMSLEYVKKYATSHSDGKLYMKRY